MPQNYTPEFKKKIVRLHKEEGRTYKSITVEYWHPLAAQAALHISKRLLQLPQTPERGLLYPKIRSSGTDQGNLP